MAVRWVLTWALVSCGGVAATCQGNSCQASDDDLLNLMQTDLRTQLGRQSGTATPLATDKASDRQSTDSEIAWLSSYFSSASEIVATIQAWAASNLQMKVTSPVLNVSTSAAMNTMILRPTYNFTSRLVDASTTLASSCQKGIEVTAADCVRAAAIVDILIPISMTPGVTISSPQIQQALSMEWWLWSPGPPSAIWQLDDDSDSFIEQAEFDQVLETQVMKDAWASTYSVQDENGDGKLSQEELYHWVRALGLLRQSIPELDLANPDASMPEVFALADLYKRMHRKPTEFHFDIVKITYLVLIACGAILLWCFSGEWITLTDQKPV